jgi:hypothetical protein
MAKVVSVFGTGKARPGDKNYLLAQQLGGLLAEAGFAIANGGYDGVMEAASKGADAAGGEVIGVTCSAFGKSSANKFVGREIVTTSLNERLDTLVQIGDAYVVLPGGTGTLLELALVWELKNKGFLSGDKPIILLGKYWNRLIELVAADDQKNRRHILTANEPKDVIELLKDRI